MHQRQDEEAIGARRDADPVIGHGIVARADRVHPDHLGAARLDLADAHLDRVAVMVLGHAEDHEQLGMVPVGLAELPEGAAHRVDTGSGHVDRAEPAMRGIVRRAEILRPEAGEGLALIPAGKEGKLRRVFLAQGRQPTGGDIERLVPADLLELARAARADALQRRPQARGRVDLHDPGAALGTEHALVHRMVAVALDIGHLAVLHVHVDPAAAGAHVARGLPHLVRHLGRGIDSRLVKAHLKIVSRSGDTL